MKKRVALLLVAAMCIGMTACSGNSSSPSNNSSASKEETKAPEEDTSETTTDAPEEDTSETTTDGEPIKIGIIYEASGSLEDWGTQEINGLKLGFEYATNGTMQINGRPIELIIEDSASDASTATEKAIKLCETDGVDILCGSTSTAVAQSVEAVALQYKTPYFVGCAAGDAICGANYNDYTFMTGRNLSQVARALAGSLSDLGDNFALMFADYAGGHQFADAYKEAMQELNLNIVYEEYPPMDCPDFTSYLMAVKGTNPDALLIACTGNSFETILPSQFNELGMSTLFPLVADVSDTESLRALGMPSVGMRGCCMYYYSNYDTPENKWLVEHHQAEYGSLPELWTGNSFTCAIAICTVLENADSIDADTIIHTAEGMTFRGVRGDYQIRPEDHITLQELPVIELADTGLDYPEPIVIKMFTADEVAPPIRN
ncbi:MAG: ABC transporter substrate-binding protein [Lachnospiraceae bacterium]|nr:ABC transporter substrate-binding protein [Lachnospiraceae bacterium]